MIDINNTLDLIKLKFHNEWLYTAHLYDEPEAEYHKELTKDIVKAYVDPLKLSKTAAILDIGCGPGYFLDEMKEREFTNYMGITLSEVDAASNRARGHKIGIYDMSFLPQADGFNDETIDFIFLRQTLEHSPYPIFTLMEYNRILKQYGMMYIEVPAPDCDRKYEFNLNHYSILGTTQWVALLERTGFKVNQFNNLTFDIELPSQDPEAEEGTKVKLKETHYCILVTKQRPLDIK
jgi:SAM-dependent methyltransferase